MFDFINVVQVIIKCGLKKVGYFCFDPKWGDKLNNFLV